MESQEEVEDYSSVDDNSTPISSLNTEIILAIIAFSIAFVWFVLSILFIKRFSFYMFFILGMGIFLLVLGLFKNRKLKNTDLDF
jgi:Flp pilus assembly protein TadB